MQDTYTRKQGVQAVIELQAAGGIEESQENAEVGWDSLSDAEKTQTTRAHKAVIGGFPPLSEFGSCLYCGGGCPSEPDKSPDLCDGFAGDVDGLYKQLEDKIVSEVAEAWPVGPEKEAAT